MKRLTREWAAAGFDSDHHHHLGERACFAYTTDVVRNKFGSSSPSPVAFHSVALLFFVAVAVVAVFGYCFLKLADEAVPEDEPMKRAQMRMMSLNLFPMHAKPAAVHSTLSFYRKSIQLLPRDVPELRRQLHKLPHLLLRLDFLRAAIAAHRSWPR